MTPTTGGRPTSGRRAAGRRRTPAHRAERARRAPSRTRTALTVVALCAALAAGSFAGVRAVLPALQPAYVPAQEASAADLAAAATAGTRPPDDAVLDLLADKYYRAVDLAALRAHPLSQLPLELSDPYTHYVPPASLAAQESTDDGEYVGVGLVLHDTALSGGRGVPVDDVVPGSPAERAGVHAGDRLVAVAGADVTAVPVDDVLKRLHGAAGSTVAVTTTRPSAHGAPVRRTATLTRARLRAVLVTGRLVTGTDRAGRARRIGYVKVREFDGGVGAAVRAQVAAAHRHHADGIVLDLRGNPGGLVDEAVTLVSAFVPRGTVVYTESGLHTPSRTDRTAADPVDARTPLVVLVDGSTASAAEITTAALRDAHRARVVGVRTFGKGVIQQTWPLPGGGGLKLTVAEYVTPSGAHVQHRGLVPDAPAPAGLTVGRLPVLFG